jgi:GDP-4-dehydro-6-deoxy-D-mannose reductase
VRVLVTGSEGFVGGHLEVRLARSGHEVWGGTLGTPPAGEPRRVRCDVTDPASVRDALRASGAAAVVHLAARSSVASSRTDPAATYAVNTMGAVHVLEAARLEDIPGPVVLVGSGEQYGDAAGGRRGADAGGAGAGSSSPGGATGGAEGPERLREEVPLRPLTPYAGSKAAAETAGLQYARDAGVRVVLTRSFAHTGPGQEPRFVLPAFARRLARIARGAREGELPAGNLWPVRDYLDVRDVVAAYALLLERGEPGSVVNVCSGEGVPLRELLEQLAAIAGVRVRIVEDPELVRPGEPARLVGDPARLLALGWRREIPRRRMLEDLWSWWKDRE